MRLSILLLALAAAAAQTPDPAREPLDNAYTALGERRYDEAIALFIKAIEQKPERAATFKDLAYTYLKVGERELARDRFRQAATLDPSDLHASLEYAFLCYETDRQAEARRTFDRLSQAADPAIRTTAAQAFQNIDQPLAAAIQRWTEAIRRGDDSFSTHHELARLAEQRDELTLAAEHYERAWRIAPERKSVLIDLGRVWTALDRALDATAALLAASRGAEPRAAERARELLPSRYPFVYEFQNALKLDPHNTDLRREFAFLLLRMNREKDAEAHFRIITAEAPSDLLAAAQLGFLYQARNQTEAARPLFERVLEGSDEELANRVRAVLRLPQVTGSHLDPGAAKLMAERSIKAGYLKDALRYLDIAHEADPVDFQVMLRLGWTYNLLHDDDRAARWFDLARKSTDPEIAGEAEHAWRNLRPVLQRFRTTAWAFPSYSSRWHDTFSYGQVKVDWNLHSFLRPYLSTRLIADTRSHADPIAPMLYSESSVILAAGLATRTWHGATLWGEAGSSIGYLSRHATPDYRGGLNFGQTRGRRWFGNTTNDAVFISRFQNDTLLYSQNRAGYRMTPAGWKVECFWNANATVDVKRQSWANFVETGPGVSLTNKLPGFPVVSINFLRGAYTVQEQTHRPAFNDLRIGVWYALTR